MRTKRTTLTTNWLVTGFTEVGKWGAVVDAEEGGGSGNRLWLYREEYKQIIINKKVLVGPFLDFDSFLPFSGSLLLD